MALGHVVDMQWNAMPWWNPRNHVMLDIDSHWEKLGHHKESYLNTTCYKERLLPTPNNCINTAGRSRRPMRLLHGTHYSAKIDDIGLPWMAMGLKSEKVSQRWRKIESRSNIPYIYIIYILQNIVQRHCGAPPPNGCLMPIGGQVQHQVDGCKGCRLAI